NNYYRDYVDGLVDLGKNDDAFNTLERSRARSLLNMLAERDMVFAQDIPADLEKERKLADAEYDSTQAEISTLSPATDSVKIKTLLARLRSIRETQTEIANRIRKASPHYASLHYPQPVNVEMAQKELDPGTTLLSFSVNSEKTELFVVQPDAF